MIFLGGKPQREKTMKKYVVDLNNQEEKRLEDLTTKGKSGARKIRRARIPLLAREGHTSTRR